MTKHGSPRPSFGDPPTDAAASDWTTPADPPAPPAAALPPRAAAADPPQASTAPQPPAAARLALGREFAVVDADDGFGALVGLPVDELCGRSLFDFIFPSERQAIFDRLNYAVMRRHDRIGCLALRRPDDRTVHIEVEVRYDPAGGEGLWLHCSRMTGGLVAAFGPAVAAAPPAVATAPGAGPADAAEHAEHAVVDGRAAPAAPIALAPVHAPTAAPIAVPTTAPAAAPARHPLGTHHPLAAPAAPLGPDGLDDAARQVLDLENRRGGAMLVVVAGGRVVAGTSAAAARVGWPAELLPGRTIDELFVLVASARARLHRAFSAGERDVVPASIVDGMALANLEWLPASAPGYGFLVVQPIQPTVGSDEHVQALQQIVRLIWHDAGDAVTSLVLGSTTLAQLLGADARRPGAARIADALAGHARMIHQAIAELRRVEHGTPVRFEPVDLGAVIEGYLDAVRGPAADEGVRITWQLTPGLHVHSTELRMRSVVRNLVTNARQILAERPGGGTIEITTEPADGDDRAGVQLVVRDDGPGMADALARVIFEPGLSDRAGGTGIGLNLVRQFIVESGGCIQPLSRQGAGTAFVIWLPTVAPEPEPPADAGRRDPDLDPPPASPEVRP